LITGVGVERQKDRVVLTPMGESLGQRHEGIVAAGEKGIHRKACGQLGGEPMGNLERDCFLLDAVDPFGPRVVPPVAGVDDDEGKAGIRDGG
jgi:hypothetical protein